MGINRKTKLPTVDPESLLDKKGEMVVPLASGWSLRSGIYPRKEGQEPGPVSGEYVRLCDPKGKEVIYWDQQEWQDDPVLVMGAIINAAAQTGAKANKTRKVSQ